MNKFLTKTSQSICKKIYKSDKQEPVKISDCAKWYDLFWLLIPCLGLEIFCNVIERRYLFFSALHDLSNATIILGEFAKGACIDLGSALINLNETTKSFGAQLGCSIDEFKGIAKF